MFNQSTLFQLGIKKIINYLRKSRQDEEYEKRTGEDTLQIQKIIMDGILIPLDIPYDQLKEIGSGDKISSRPVFQDILDYLREEKYQAIAVKEISRMGRGNYTDMGVIYDLLIEKRIFIITPYRIYDPNNHADARQIRFELFMSREEFETTRERLNGGRYVRALSGGWVAGKPPFGYDLNSVTTKLVINEEQANIVRLLFELYKNGVPKVAKSKNMISYKDVRARAISTYLHSMGILSPQGKLHWRPEIIMGILKNDVYLGTIRYRQTSTSTQGKVLPRPTEEHIVVRNAHPPIIDTETWDMVQQKISESVQTPHVKLDAQTYELSGLCRCVKCGRRMMRQAGNVIYISKVTGKETPYKKEMLWCTTIGCTYVKYGHIVEDVVEALKYLRDLDPDQIRNNIEKIMENTSKGTRKTEEEIRLHTLKRISDLEARRQFIYQNYEDRIYTREIFHERLEPVESELKLLQKSIEKTNVKIQMDEHVIDPTVVKNNMGSILEAYYAVGEDRAARNEILRKVFSDVRVEVLEKGSGRRPPKTIIYPELKLNILRSGILSE